MQTPAIVTMRFINSSLNMLKCQKEQPRQQQLSIVKSLIELEGEIKKVPNVLGLLSTLSYSEVLKQLMEKAPKRAEVTEDNVSKFIEDMEL